MMLSESIARYVSFKRGAGLEFRRPESVFLRFNIHVGDIAIDKVTTKDISDYLNSNIAYLQVWQIKYCLLRRFFEYWAVHGVIPPVLMPYRRTPVRSNFFPYVYTHAEVRRLLDEISRNQDGKRFVVEAKTFRMASLLLYATGMTLREALRLTRRDVDFKHRKLTVYSARYSKLRQIPFGNHLSIILRDYISWRFGSRRSNELLFVRRSGSPINCLSIQNAFAKLVRTSGLRRRDGLPNWPRMSDLRASFAVHRITAWLKDGSNLNQMLPALATYLGQSGLGSIEGYLKLAPERFRKQLLSLSPQKGRRHWRDDANLMQFLATM
jgi:integrase/recombinase XerD